MKKILIKFIIAFSPIILFFVFWCILYTNELFINTTKSMPIGIYKICKDQNIKKGDIVIFYPDNREIFKLGKERGYFERTLLKKVIGNGGDFIEISKHGIKINGQQIQQSQALNFDSRQRPVKNINLAVKLQNGQFIVLGNTNKSFDSRYFGIINLKANNIKKAKLILNLD